MSMEIVLYFFLRKILKIQPSNNISSLKMEVGRYQGNLITQVLSGPLFQF